MHVDDFFSYRTLLGFLYAFSRLSGVFAFLPLAVFRAAPEPARIILAASFTIMLRSHWQSPENVDLTAGRIVPGLAGEVALGLAIGLTLAIVLEVFQMAAQVISVQAGFGHASTIDPTSGADSTVLLTISQIISGLLFFVSGADRLLIRALADSLTILPPESFAIQRSWGAAIIKYSAGIFTSGLRLAAPVITLVLLTDASLSVLGRMQPQMQLVSLTMPVKLGAAMLVIALTIGVYPSFFESLTFAWVRLIESLIRTAH